MSSIKDFELAQRIYIATHELKARIAALEAERDALHELLRSIVYRLNGGRDATSIAIIVDCDAAIDAARSKP